MCRREIPQSFLEHPTLLKPESLASNTTKHDEHKKEDTEDEYDDDESTQEFRWFYQGRNGWWEYDERTASELEHHHKKGDKNCELLIAGFLYSIDFENMLQSRRNEPQRRRQIKRDLISNVSDKKGVAGIRTTATNGATSSSSTTTSNANLATTSGMDDLANQMSNVSLNNPQPISTRPTLRNLVDLGASGASISLSQEADDEDDDANVV